MENKFGAVIEFRCRLAANFCYGDTPALAGIDPIIGAAARGADLSPAAALLR
jgi:hypothetical protein